MKSKMKYDRADSMLQNPLNPSILIALQPKEVHSAA